MADSVIEKNIRNSEFPYLQPFFYNHPYSVRCELGIGDGDLYLQTARQRAMELYRMLFPQGADALFFDYWIYDPCASGPAECEADDADILEEIHQNSIENEVSRRRFLFYFQDRYRHVVVRILKDHEDDEEDESFLRRNRVICYSDGKGFEAEKLIFAQIENQTNPLVSFVSFDGEFIFSVYDDRGCDIVFAAPEAFAAHYNELKPYFLGYDAELMQSRMDAIQEKSCCPNFTVQAKE